MSALTARGVVDSLRWYLREVTGESAYDRYLETARHHDPHVPVLTRDAFERARQDRRDAHPPQRCC